MTTHPCPIPQCEHRISKSLLMCWPHWRRVPKFLQRVIWREVKSADRTEYTKAVKQAIEIVTEKVKA